MSVDTTAAMVLMSGPTQEVAQIVACTTTTVILVTVLDMDLAIRAIDLDMVPDMVPGTPAMALATLAMDLDMVQVMALAILVITGGRYKHLTPARIYKRRY